MQFNKIYKEKVLGEQNQECFERMTKQIEEAGGMLNFVMTIDEEGWFAKCEEFPGIVTGGTSTNPSEKEISSALIDSIKTAFHVPIRKQLGGKGVATRQSLQMPKKINLQRQFQLA